MSAIKKLPDQAEQAEPDLIGRHLRALREGRSESIRDVADAVSCSAKHLWAVENGNVQRPGNELLVNLADHFQVSLDELFGRTVCFDSTYLPDELVKRWHRMPKSARENIMRLIEVLTD